MPSFVLSLALLLLVLLTLLALSNRELVALTFLGVSTVALPLSVWIFGAIAAGFLLGLWILLLFRFGTAGVTPGSGRGVPFRDQRRANYGPEDFAVVDERFAGDDDREAREGYDDRRYEGAGYRDRRYDDGSYADSRYSDNRYDDIYGQQDDRAAGYDQESYEDYDRTGYRSTGDSANPRSDRYRDRAEPQDSFSAASGYGAGRDSIEREDIEQSQAFSPAQEAATGESQAELETATTVASTGEPAVPADWDDPYREDWTEAELIAEPVLRNEPAAPKLKRWFGGRSQPQPTDSQSQEALRAQSSEAALEPSPSGAADWQPAERERPPSGNASNVYDADYRVVKPPKEASQTSHPAPQPQPGPSAGEQDRPKESRDRPGSEWDIESDLDW